MKETSWKVFVLEVAIAALVFALGALVPQWVGLKLVVLVSFVLLPILAIGGALVAFREKHYLPFFLHLAMIPSPLYLLGLASILAASH